MAYEGISSYLHNKRQKALQKVFDAMERKVKLERNKIFCHLEDSMVMYGIYNVETLVKLVYVLEIMQQKLHGMKGYLPVNLLIGLIDIIRRRCGTLCYKFNFIYQHIKGEI